MKKVLTIAGSDCSGGAGIQADLKTMTANNCYGMSVITALTAQNTRGVSGILNIDSSFVGMQLDSVFTDIFPDAIKIGMVSQAEIINIISEKLKEYDAKAIVVDPVMVSTSGSKLLSESAMEAIIKKLIPMADVITPNIKEAEVLSEIKIETEEDMIKSAEIISKMLDGAVLIKGGHLKASANDLLYWNNEITWFESRRINSTNTHGTGCTLSSAIACGLAKGQDLKSAISEAKAYITGALNDGLDLGGGSGPLNHMWC